VFDVAPAMRRYRDPATAARCLQILARHAAQPAQGSSCISWRTIEDRADDISVLECYRYRQAHRFMAKAADPGGRDFRFFADNAPTPATASTCQREHEYLTACRSAGGVITPDTPFMLSTLRSLLAGPRTVVHKPRNVAVTRFCSRTVSRRRSERAQHVHGIGENRRAARHEADSLTATVRPCPSSPSRGRLSTPSGTPLFTSFASRSRDRTIPPRCDHLQPPPARTDSPGRQHERVFHGVITPTADRTRVNIPVSSLDVEPCGRRPLSAKSRKSRPPDRALPMKRCPAGIDAFEHGDVVGRSSIAPHHAGSFCAGWLHVARI